MQINAEGLLFFIYRHYEVFGTNGTDIFYKSLLVYVNI